MIRSETSDQAARIVKVETTTDQIKQDVVEIKKDIKDTLNHALDRALGMRQSAPSSQNKNTSSLVVGKSILEMASRLKIDLDLSLVKRYQSQIRSITDVAGQSAAYWDAAGQLVTYQSAIKVGPKVAKKTISVLRPCAVPKMAGLTLDTQFLCVLDLDGLHLEDAAVENSIVTYRGGETWLRNVDFKNCYFIIDVQGKPGRKGQNVIRTLLASDSANVLLSSG